MKSASTTDESGVAVRRVVETTGEDIDVTVRVESSQGVPLLVRLLETPPRPGATDRRIRGTDLTPVGGADPDHDCLEWYLVVDPGDCVTVRYTLTHAGGATTTTGETTPARTGAVTIAAVLAVAPGTDWLSEPTALWRTDAGVRHVPLTPSKTEPRTWTVGPDTPRETAYAPDGGEPESHRGRSDTVRSNGDGLDVDWSTKSDVTTVPAVGIIATPENRESVIRTVTRARERGHRAYVTYDDDAGERTARIGEQLGAIVVEPPERGERRMTLREELERRARDDGFPGVIIQPDGAPAIDYGRTREGFEHAGFVTAAIPEPWSEPDGRPHVVIAIPAFNAADTVGEVVRQAEAFADVVIVVDDGSDDDTGTVADRAGALVVAHDRNRGYGAALKTAFTEADRLDADHLVVLDADGQHDPADVPHLVEAQAAHDAEIVIGSRYVKGSRTRLPLVRRIGLGAINVLTNLSLGHVRPSSFIHDTQSGFRAYDRRAIASLAADPDIGDRMGASTDIIYHAHRERYDIHEVGTTIRYDVEHGSTLDPVSHGYSLVRNIFHTLTVVHPFKTLGVIGGVTASAGIGVALEGIGLGLVQGEFPFVKTYLATLVGVIGVILILVAVDYHTLRTHPSYRRLRK